ncbi:MAG: hypothetical protein QF440_06210 [Candidatus Thalassarchaeaceae archaeon]|jgi:hypothetical protein|nr:hypothetical protein [Candidatus Thalassarchaeaceae archaeon]
MEGLIRDLLAQLGAIISPAPPHPPCPGINLLGIISTPPGTRSAPDLPSGTHLWHAYDGWAPLDSLEIERWLVDAPEGTHWLLSERVLRMENQPSRRDVNYDVWGPDRFAQWLGEAILNGDLNASIPDSIPQSVPGTVFEEESLGLERRLISTEPSALRPIVKLESIIQNLGQSNVNPRPVLLNARIWSVTGILRGPNDAAERQWWELLEDPFTNEIDHLGKVEVLDFIPKLHQFQPNSWQDESILAPHLASLCEERRHFTITEKSGTSQVQGSVLHWWKLDPSSAEMIPRLALLPAWQITIPSRGDVLIHGLTGEIVPLP